VRHPAHATSELIDVVNLVTQAFWAELRRSGQTIEMSQWSTLRRIGRTPCTMSELARYKGVGLPTISKSVDMLVRRGWVERWVDKSDRRQTLVRLTAAGRRILTECRRALEEFLDERLAALSAPERNALDHSLQMVRRALTHEDRGAVRAD
jgi:DNA-binding MarR family transcriptional regulator